MHLKEERPCKIFPLYIFFLIKHYLEKPKKSVYLGNKIEF